MSSNFDYIQTVYVNPDAVNSATSVMVTSVNLYFKAKPSTVNNISGLAAPGITVWLCNVVNGVPDPASVIQNSYTIVNYNAVNTTTNASVATTATFQNPIVVPSGQYVGIAVKFDDPAFSIWYNRKGDALVDNNGKTNTASTGSQSKFQGDLYTASSSSALTLADTSLKFELNVAQFTASTGSFNLVNKEYEFFTVNSVVGNYINGEVVYQPSANLTGTVAISSISNTVVGTGTSFNTLNINDDILLTDGTALNTCLVSVTAITNSTYMQVATMPSFTSSSINYSKPVTGRVFYSELTKNKVYLVDSTAANTAFRFNANSSIKGVLSGASANVVSVDNYSIDHFNPKFLIGNPTSSDYNITYQLSTAANALSTSTQALTLLTMNDTSYDAYILSRSIEVDTTASGTLYGANRKSVFVNVAVTSTVSGANFSVPYIKSTDLDFYTYQNDINGTTLVTKNLGSANVANYDTEVDRNGLGLSKYISTKVTFAKNKFAEDLVVYLTAYRPAGTDLQLYGKVYNSNDPDTFDDKQWSPLELKSNHDAFSTGPSDFIEYQFGLPQTPDVDRVLTGTFSVTTACNVIRTTSDLTTILGRGDLISVYDPLIPINHQVFAVQSLTSNTVTVNALITDVDIIGTMAASKLKYRNVAYNNIANENVARYFSSSLIQYDTFNSMQIKVVFTSNNSYLVPNVQQLQAIGVSA